jgi:hypothetical protein
MIRAIIVCFNLRTCSQWKSLSEANVVSGTKLTYISNAVTVSIFFRLNDFQNCFPSSPLSVECLSHRRNPGKNDRGSKREPGGHV